MKEINTYEEALSLIKEESYYSLKHMPKKFITQELCDLAVGGNGRSLRFVPDEFITQEMCQKAIDSYSSNLKFVPKKFVTQEMCKKAVDEDGFNLGYVPDEFRTKEICEEAIKDNGDSLEYVPKELITKEMCEMAINQSGSSLRFVPNELITKELCEMAIDEYPTNIEYVPEEFKTKEICEKAIDYCNEFNYDVIFNSIPNEIIKRYPTIITNVFKDNELKDAIYRDIDIYFDSISGVFNKFIDSFERFEYSNNFNMEALKNDSKFFLNILQDFVNLEDYDKLSKDLKPID